MNTPCLRFYTGGLPMHPTTAQAGTIRDWLGDSARCEIVEGPAAFEGLEEVDLLVMMGLHWTGMAADWAKRLPYESPTPAQRAGFLNYAASGRPLLLAHGGIASFCLASKAWNGPTLLLCPAGSRIQRLAGLSSIPDPLTSLQSIYPPRRSGDGYIAPTIHIVHSTHDKTIPFADTQSIYDTTPHAGYLTIEPITTDRTHALRKWCTAAGLAERIQRVLDPFGAVVPQEPRARGRSGPCEAAQVGLGDPRFVGLGAVQAAGIEGA